MGSYQPFPALVSRSLREAVAARYHLSLGDEFGWNLFQYLLMAPVDKDTGRIVLPWQTLYHMAGRNPASRRTNDEDAKNSAQMLRAFERETGLALDIQAHNRFEGMARTVAPEIDPDILALAREPLRNTLPANRVFFATGQPYSRRRYRDAVEAYDASLQAQMDAIPADHPAYGLACYLERGQDYMCRVLARTWPCVEEAIAQMPTGTEHEGRRKEYAQRLARRLQARPAAGEPGAEDGKRLHGIHYRYTDRSVRLFGCGGTILQLPRPLRHLAFAGAIEVDLKQAQLCIAARLWECPLLREFLGDPAASIWTTLLQYLGVDVEHKDILKRTLYAALFGMGKRGIRDLLAGGDNHCCGIGGQCADRFLEHPYIVELMQARERVAEGIRAAGGADDAFGRWIALPPPRKKKAAPEFSVLCQVVQSWELRVMLALLPVLQSPDFRQVYPLAYLFDGITLWFADEQKQARQVERLQRAIQTVAEEHGIAVQLEAKRLPTLAEHIGAETAQRVDEKSVRDEEALPLAA